MSAQIDTAAGPQRMGMVIGIRADHVDEYKRLHAAVWPDVLRLLREAHVRNYSIFLREPELLLFGYWEYEGSDFEADMARVAADPVTRRWWTLCSPCQAPLATRAPGEHWAAMPMIFHID